MYSFLAQIFKADDVVVNQLVPVWPAIFYAFAHRKALHDRPSHSIGFDIFFYGTDFLP